MAIVTLEEAVKQELNNLSATDLELSYAYSHDIRVYGITALAHAFLFQRARGLLEGKITLSGFIRKYRLHNFSGCMDKASYREKHPYSVCDGFRGSLKVIEKQVFIPQHAYWDIKGKRRRRTLCFFTMDQGNVVDSDFWLDREYAEALIQREWQPSDLKNPELIEQGLRFGRDMWQVCVSRFEKYKDGSQLTDTAPQPAHITELGRKLIEYYSSIISQD